MDPNQALSARYTTEIRGRDPINVRPVRGFPIPRIARHPPVAIQRVQIPLRSSIIHQH